MEAIYAFLMFTPRISLPQKFRSVASVVNKTAQLKVLRSPQQRYYSHANLPSSPQTEGKLLGCTSQRHNIFGVYLTSIITYWGVSIIVAVGTLCSDKYNHRFAGGKAYVRVRCAVSQPIRESICAQVACAVPSDIISYRYIMSQLGSVFVKHSALL